MIDYGYFGLVKGNVIVDAIALVSMIIADLGLILSVMSLIGIICRFVPAVINNPVSRFLGMNCLEIYALQGLVLRILYQIIPSKIVYAIVSALCIIGVAALLHYPINLIMKRIKGTN
jgi:peptidoglycan/LPS O-acetylase OafA/YrhL